MLQRHKQVVCKVNQKTGASQFCFTLRKTLPPNFEPSHFRFDLISHKKVVSMKKVVLHRKMDESYNLAATKRDMRPLSFEIEASAALRGGLIFSHCRVVPGSNTISPKSLFFLFSPSPSIHK